MMNASGIALLAFGIIFGSVLLGMRLRAALPEHHLSPDTKDTVRLGMGLIATMTALLLGLLIASAKGSYDTQRSEVIQLAAKVSFMDRMLGIYGPEAADARSQLRGATEDLTQKLWQDKSAKQQGGPTISSGQSLFTSIQKLAPQTDEQRSLKDEALESTIDISKTRWRLFALEDSAIPKPFLILVVTWLAIIFLSFGLFAPSNKTVIATMMIVALLVSSALFLILELDQPFDGIIQISNEPLRSALRQLGN